MLQFALLNLSKLISHKIWVTEKFFNFHSVKHNFFQIDFSGSVFCQSPFGLWISNGETTNFQKIQKEKANFWYQLLECILNFEFGWFWRRFGRRTRRNFSPGSGRKKVRKISWNHTVWKIQKFTLTHFFGKNSVKSTFSWRI